MTIIACLSLLSAIALVSSPIVTLVSFMGIFLFSFCHLWEPFVEGISHQGLRFPYSIFLSRRYLTEGRREVLSYPVPSEQVFKTRKNIFNKFLDSPNFIALQSKIWGQSYKYFYTSGQIYKCIHP